MSALLQVCAVSVCHWRGHRPVQALDEVSFDLSAGEFGGVWGDRCAGKTTLVRTVAGLLAPDRGEVRFEGRPLRAGAGDPRSPIGFASRSGPLLEDLAVEEWIATIVLEGRTWRAALADARAVLERVGVGTLGGERWRDLSDGERMLAAIAHAIVRHPRLLVVDDPVAGMGVVGRAAVMELLRSIADDGVAVLMTAGDVAEFHGANRIWGLEAGRLDGPPARPAGRVVSLRGA
jgi:ABC-type multidrug transport system ATPase subunit